MDIPVLFEDDNMVAINKPPGVVVNKAQSVHEETIQDWVLTRNFLQLDLESKSKTRESASGGYDIVQEFISRSGIVHRIDKETSGVLLIAKTPASFGALKDQFLERTIQKVYRALVHGVFPTETGEIRAPIGRLPWNREHFGVMPDGREAVTEYRVLEQFSYKKEKYAYVEAYPKTGRTHQIRVHLKYMNHPIVADYLYAGRKTSRDDRRWAPRVMLHAYQLTCTHPVSKEVLCITAQVPDDFASVLTMLKSQRMV